jgi:hypothetical protein
VVIESKAVALAAPLLFATSTAGATPAVLLAQIQPLQ